MLVLSLCSEFFSDCVWVETLCTRQRVVCTIRRGWEEDAYTAPGCSSLPLFLCLCPSARWLPTACLFETSSPCLRLALSSTSTVYLSLSLCRSLSLSLTRSLFFVLEEQSHSVCFSFSPFFLSLCLSCLHLNPLMFSSPTTLSPYSSRSLCSPLSCRAEDIAHVLSSLLSLVRSISFYRFFSQSLFFNLSLSSFLSFSLSLSPHPQSYVLWQDRVIVKCRVHSALQLQGHQRLWWATPKHLYVIAWGEAGGRHFGPDIALIVFF